MIAWVLFTRLNRAKVFSRLFSQIVYCSIVSQMLQYETEGLARITTMDGTVFRFLSFRQSYLVLFNLIFPFRLSKSALFYAQFLRFCVSHFCDLLMYRLDSFCSPLISWEWEPAIKPLHRDGKDSKSTLRTWALFYSGTLNCITWQSNWDCEH